MSSFKLIAVAACVALASVSGVVADVPVDGGQVATDAGIDESTAAAPLEAEPTGTAATEATGTDPEEEDDGEEYGDDDEGLPDDDELGDDDEQVQPSGLQEDPTAETGGLGAGDEEDGADDGMGLDDGMDDGEEEDDDGMDAGLDDGLEDGEDDGLEDGAEASLDGDLDGLDADFDTAVAPGAVDVDVDADMATAPMPPAPTPPTPPGECKPAGPGVVPEWGQCGGKKHTGPTDCGDPAYFECKFSNPYYSQCIRLPEPGKAGPWDKCGGKDYNGPTECAQRFECVVSNPYYSQCLPCGSGN